VAIAKDWERRIGNQRDWVWRGWQVRYTFLCPPECGSQEKPPLIFLHGFGACIEHWRHNLPVLSQQHPVYVINVYRRMATSVRTEDEMPLDINIVILPN
jgi:pimeloyl-ACP methyl ester carboxylesterase